MDPIELNHPEELDSFLGEFGSRSRIKRDSTSSIRSRSRSRKNSLNDRNNEQSAAAAAAAATTAAINNIQNQNNNNNIWRSQDFLKIQITPPSNADKGEKDTDKLNQNNNKDLESGRSGKESECLKTCSCDSKKTDKGDGVCDCDGDNDADLKNALTEDELDKDDNENSTNKFTGLSLALMSCVAFSLSSLIVKYLSEYHPFSKCVWRFQGLVLPAIPMMLYANKYKKEPIFETVWPVCKNSNWKNILFLTLRATAGYATIILQFYSLQYVTLADQMVLGSSQPVFVSIVAYFLLGEKCGIVPFAICCMTIVGVCIVAKPPILTGSDGFDKDVLFGSALAMGSMGMSVMSIIFMRRMKNVHFTLITFSFGIYSTVISLIFAFVLSVFQLPQGRDHILLAIALACLVFASQTCTTLALKYEQAGPVSLTRTSNIIFGFIWQYLFLGVLPDHLSLIGASIIVVGVVLTALRKWVSTLPEKHATRIKFGCLLR